MASAGVMRGAGRQLLASILNLITYWVLGLPLAILLGVYFNLGVEGLWWALLITTSVQVSPVTHTRVRNEIRMRVDVYTSAGEAIQMRH